MAFRIVLCDDHVVFSDALTAALESRGHQVLAIGDRLPDAVELVARYQPDVLVVDRLFPDDDALDWLKRLRSAAPETKIVMLSGALDPTAVSRAKLAGVIGLVGKDGPITEVLRAVELAGSGSMVDLTEQNAPRLGRTTPLETLTDRERDVLNCLVEGLSTPEAAKRLGISYNTARGHVQGILQKLEARSALQAVAIAMQAEDESSTRR